MSKGRVAMSSQVGLQLLEALGLKDMKYVRSITLRATTLDAVTVCIERFVMMNEMPRVRQVLEQYELRPKDSP